MKTYKTTVYPSQHELYELFAELINPRFKNKVKSGSLELLITNTSDGIEIGQPQYYDGYLYKVKISGNEVLVKKSEHYVDDVNSLALEDIIDNIIVEYLGVNHIETILLP
jgi:hypothetical protein